MTPARYIMIGGFLGAGKTTAILQLAEMLKKQNLRVGLITNDQSVGLVDTTMLMAHDFPVEEITGGCFCCKFSTLTDAAEKLNAAEQPEVFLAEPVGSCTDLTATVSYPLRRMYGNDYSIAPYSVLVDPVRAERILGLAEGKNFSPKVIYIYKKQLEEAEIIVINKLDTLDETRLQKLEAALKSEFPQAKVIAISARNSVNLDEWLRMITDADLGTTPAMDVDYDTYAEGEALLGWVNATCTVEQDEFDGNAFLNDFIVDLHNSLQEADIEVAHLKMTLSPDEGNDLAVANLVRTDGKPEFSHTLEDKLTSGELIINLRAEGDPEILKAYLLNAIDDSTTTVQHLEAFRPGRPVPTHRDT